MLGIDLLLLAGGAVVLVLGAGLLGGWLGPRAEARRRRVQGEQNAEREKQRLEELCTVCGESIDPVRDVREAGQWWHQACYRELLR